MCTCMPGGLLRKPPLKCTQGCARRSVRRSFSANTSLRRSTTTLCRVGLGPRIMRSGAYTCELMRRLAREFQPGCALGSAAYLPLMSHILRQLQYKLNTKWPRNWKKLQFLCTFISGAMCELNLHMSHEIGQNSWISSILSDFLKKIAIFCNFLHKWICAYVPWIQGFPIQSLLKSGLNLKKIAIFVHLSRPHNSAYVPCFRPFTIEFLL